MQKRKKEGETIKGSRQQRNELLVAVEVDTCCHQAVMLKPNHILPWISGADPSLKLVGIQWTREHVISNVFFGSRITIKIKFCLLQNYIGHAGLLQ